MCGIAPLVVYSLAAQANSPILLQVDASDAPRNMIHVLEKVPVRPGPFQIYFPKWPPGHHSPSGSIANVIDFHVLANGKEISWKRDGAEMFDIHVDVPQGVNQLQVVFVDAMQPGREMTSSLGRAKFTELVFLPKGNVEKMYVDTTFKAPAGWTVFDAQPLVKSGDVYQFPEVTAERLLDSPILMGLYAKAFPLAGGHEMDVVADEPKDLEIKPETLQGMKNLVAEAHALWGAQHYRHYNWLLSLSNFGAFDGLEHNECSEDGSGADTFTSPGGNEGLGDLLSHEYTHSWNGKYRRPADLYQTDYLTPQEGSLLWVYEGMTQYWGNILPTRSGLWTMQNLEDTFARNAASMAYRSGRTWRSTEDTAASASIVRSAGTAWNNARRAQDYYIEGTLVWVGADAIIRKQTNDKKSLDDFCKIFGGGRDTGPMIVPYTYQELLKDLNKVTPYDWDGYFQRMVYSVHAAPTTEGLEAAGWRLAFTDKPAERRSGGRPGRGQGGADHTYDLGVTLDADGSVTDMVVGSPADQAGLTPGMKIITVGNKPYSAEALDDAIKEAAAPNLRGGAPLSLQVVKDGVVFNVRVDYAGGLKYPHLERIPGTVDYLSEIAKPKAMARP